MNDRLESMLRSKGYGFHKIGGNFFENEEHSVMVPNMTREDAIELGKRLKQYSVIFGSKNVTGDGRVFMKHQMLRTYCDGECKKSRNWDKLPLNKKLRGLKPLSKEEVGYVESERNVSITDKDIQSKITNYSYVDDDRRRFSIPFYDDPKASAYPSQEYGKNIVPYQYDMTKQRDLSTKEKFGFLDYEMNENYKIRINEGMKELEELYIELEELIDMSMEITGEYANDPYDAITSLEEEGSEESLDLMERIKYVEEEIDQIEAEMYFDEEESDNVEENYKSTKKVIKLTEKLN
jgi:hypothetical protein